MKAESRRTPPLGIKLQGALAQLEAAMRKLGMIPVEEIVIEWEFDHDPALGLRYVDPETGKYEPDQLDIRFLIWRPKTAHRVKTTGRHGESDLSFRDGDAQKLAKVRRRDKRRSAREEPQAEQNQRPKMRSRPMRQPKPRLRSTRAPAIWWGPGMDRSR